MKPCSGDTRLRQYADKLLNRWGNCLPLIRYFPCSFVSGSCEPKCTWLSMSLGWSVNTLKSLGSMSLMDFVFVQSGSKQDGHLVINDEWHYLKWTMQIALKKYGTLIMVYIWCRGCLELDIRTCLPTVVQITVDKRWQHTQMVRVLWFALCQSNGFANSFFRAGRHLLVLWCSCFCKILADSIRICRNEVWFVCCLWIGKEKGKHPNK